MTRKISTPLLVLLATLTIIAAVSWLRFTESNKYRDADRIKRETAERVVYYRVDAYSGPGFRLVGGERAVRIITHLGLPKSVAWPAERYDPQRGYAYGLRILLRDKDKNQLWHREIHMRTRQSKADFDGNRWTFESAFVEDHAFEVSDSRVLHIELPSHVPVDAELELRFLGDPQYFALARAYRVGELEEAEQALRAYQLSPEDKALLVQDTTYLEWDEVGARQKRQRLSLRLERLAASAEGDQAVVGVPIFISPYRRSLPERTIEASQWILGPWERSYVVSGPTRVDIGLRPRTSESMSSRSRLPGQSVTGQLVVQDLRPDGQQSTYKKQVELIPSTGASSGILEINDAILSLEIEEGVHSLDIRWEPNPPADASLNATGWSERMVDWMTNALPPIKSPTSLAPALELDLRLRRAQPSLLWRDGWVSSGYASTSAYAEPVLMRTYFVGPQTPAIRFPVQPGDTKSRVLEVEARFWDTPGKHVELGSDIALQYAFLDENGKEIMRSTKVQHADFDPSSWVEFRTKEPVRGEVSNFVVGVSQAQPWKVIAPTRARWIEFRAVTPLLMRVMGWASAPAYETPHQPPFDEVVLGDVRWKMAPLRARSWMPIRANQHETWRHEGWIVDVATQLRLEPKEPADELTENQRWAALTPEGRPQQQSILEEVTFRGEGLVQNDLLDTRPTRDEFWADCPGCWSEVSSRIEHFVIDTAELANDPRILLRGPEIRRRPHLDGTRAGPDAFRVRVDGDHVPVGWRAHQDGRSLSELAEGFHRFQWWTPVENTRLWVNRRAVPVSMHRSEAANRVFAPRTVYRLNKSTLQFRLFKKSGEPLVANFRIYRKPRKEPASREGDENAQAKPDANTSFVVYFELDGGEPIRAIGQMGEHFTQGLEEVAVAPQSEVELVYLDDDGSGVYERYHAVLFVGDDVRSGSHRVRMWSSEPGEIWVRGFQREIEQPSEESRQWKTQAPIGEERATVTRRQ